MDEGWQAMKRDEDGRQQPNTTSFPKGIGAIADFVHSKGLKVGIYSDAGYATISYLHNFYQVLC
jgi:alpha-galactosidase